MFPAHMLLLKTQRAVCRSKSSLVGVLRPGSGSCSRGPGAGREVADGQRVHEPLDALRFTYSPVRGQPPMSLRHGWGYPPWR